MTWRAVREDSQPSQMDVKPSRQASTPITDEQTDKDHPELLGEVGTSPPLWVFSISGAGTGQRSPLAQTEPGTLTRARSRREGLEPMPARVEAEETIRSEASMSGDDQR
jgi:hypothetical protein